MKRAKRRGFTLIELLVVIAIVAVLAAFLFPVLSRARQRGYQSTCASNLRQLGLAFQLYCDERGDRPVDVAGNPDWPWSWNDRLRAYEAADGIYVCPSNLWYQTWRDTAGRVEPELRYRLNYPELSRTAQGNLCFSTDSSLEGQGIHWLRTTYAVSIALSAPAWDAPTPGANLTVTESVERAPSQAILLGETRIPDNIQSWIDPGLAAIDAKLLITGAGAQEDYPPPPPQGRLIHTHAGRTNWLFLDGHVEALSVRQTLVPTNRWTCRPVDQPAFDALAERLAPEYQ